MISRPIFEAQFKKAWNLLEPYEPKPEKISAYYDELKDLHPGHVTRAFAFFSKVNPSKESDKWSKFPSGPVILERVKIFEKEELARRKANLNSIPATHSILSEAEINAEYDLIKSFMDAYPHPGCEPRSSANEGEATDRNYCNLMRRAGIKNIHEQTHPEVGKRLMGDLMAKINF